MNGDSSKLPVPAGTVDAVVTDPPYFDFVHYSELSDFFLHGSHRHYAIVIRGWLVKTLQIPGSSA